MTSRRTTPPPAPLNVPKQARSRDTLHRLLQAAEEILSVGDLDAATVPAIAARAGVSVGVVYRRFPDKDALLKAVYERFFAQMAEQNRRGLETLARLSLPLPVMARTVITGMAEGYRRKRGLLRALIQYKRTHGDPEYRRAAEEMNRSTTHAVAALLMTHADSIRHPDPRTAITFGLMTIAALLREVVLEDEPMPGLERPAHLEEELVRMFFGYVGIEQG